MQRASITLAISRRIVIHAIVVAATASAVVVGAFFGFPRVVGGAIEVLVPIKDDGRRAWFTGHPAACLRRPFRRFAVLARGAPVPARQGPVIAALVRLPTRGTVALVVIGVATIIRRRHPSTGEAAAGTIDVPAFAVLPLALTFW